MSTHDSAIRNRQSAIGYVTVEVVAWVTRFVGGDGTRRQVFQEPVAPDARVRSVLGQVGDRHPALAGQDRLVRVPGDDRVDEPRLEPRHELLEELAEAARLARARGAGPMFKHWQTTGVENVGGGAVFLQYLRTDSTVRVVDSNLTFTGKGKVRSKPDRINIELSPWLEAGIITISDADTPYLRALKRLMDNFFDLDPNDEAWMQAMPSITLPSCTRKCCGWRTTTP